MTFTNAKMRKGGITQKYLGILSLEDRAYLEYAVLIRTSRRTGGISASIRIRRRVRSCGDQK